MHATSETDEDDRTLVSDENGFVNDGRGGGGGEEEGAGSPAGVLATSPHVARALLSCRGQEGSGVGENFDHGWRLGDDTTGESAARDEESVFHQL